MSEEVENENEMSYEEYIQNATNSPLNDVRLLVTDAVQEMWEPHMPGTCRAYSEAQFEMMEQFCKVIMQTCQKYVGAEPDYEELSKRSYKLLADHFKRHGTHLTAEAYQMLFHDFNNRIVINFYTTREPGEEYEYRTLVMALDALPIEILRTPQYMQFQCLRYSHEHELSLTH